MNQYISEMSQAGFFPGFLLGLIVAALLLGLSLIREHRRRREIRRLIAELQSQADIAGRSTRVLKERISELKRRNVNLEDAIAVWERRPRRAELRRLLVCEEAVAALKERIPGFIQAWEQARREAEEEMARSNRGLGGIFRRLSRRRPGGRTAEEPAAYLGPGEQR